MATITDYNTLIQAVRETAEDDGSEFTSYIPTAIDLAEERLFKELDLPQLEQRESGSLIMGNPILNKPSSYEFASNFNILVGNRKKIMKKKRESYVEDYWPDSAVVGTPKYYADSTGSTFRISPTPDQNYPYELKYTAKPVKLSTTNPTNIFVTHCKDALFFATMTEIAKFMKAWAQIQVFEADYIKQRDALNIEAMRYRRDGEFTPMNPASPVNSLKHTINTGA